MEIVDAHGEEFIPIVRRLFEEYAEWLDFDLCFQDFGRELANLPGAYAPPDGALLLGRVDGEWAGCVALRPLAAGGFCEMKRMYVRPAFRGRGFGRQLALRIIDFARDAGYTRMRLDTIASMTGAMALYNSLGFRNIAPYTHNPIEGAAYFELDLVAGNPADA